MGTLHRRAAIVQGLWAVVALSVWTLLMLQSPLDPDYTAGELLDHLMAWRETGVLYPPLGEQLPFRVLNYPPLALLIARAGVEAGLSALTAGRLMNGGAVLLVIGTLAWWMRARGARGVALGGIVGLLGASIPFLYASGQFHVELWAVFGTLAGVALLDRGEERGACFAAGLFLAMACLAKQTQVIPALVALAWAWRHRRPAFGPTLLGYALGGSIGVSLISSTWGMEAWNHLLTYTTGTYSLGTLLEQMSSHLAPWSLLLAVAAWRGVTGGARQRSDIAWWYWCGAIAWSFSSARDGAGYPYFLDVHLATIVLVGPLLFSPDNRGAAPRAARGRWLLPLVLVVQVVGADIAAGTLLTLNARTVADRTSHLTVVCGEDLPPGPMLVEEAGLARACGRRPLLHPFIMASLAARGLWSPTELEKSVADGDYPVAVIGFDPREPVTGAQADRWTPGMVEAFRSARSVERLGAGWWLLRW